MKQYDVVALGELLIDFTDSGVSVQGNPLFAANPGGAPCNVLAMLAALGRRTAFIGKVGQDIFGSQLREALVEVGIDTQGLVADAAVNTTLAFVKNSADGDCAFSFFRNPGADTQLQPEEVPRALVEDCRVFHFGTLSMTDQPAINATQAAVALARQAGALLSFDPNLRPALWRDMQDARRAMHWGCAACDVLKLADEELLFLMACDDVEKALAQLQKEYPNVQVILLTKGRGGAECLCNGLRVARPTYLQVQTIDTTGAGDTFVGCCLSYLLGHPAETLHEEQMGEMLENANAAASLVTARMGALRSMPCPDEILALRQQGPLV